MRPTFHLLILLSLTGALLLGPGTATARPRIVEEAASTRGRPHVELDRLVFAPDIAADAALEKHMRKVLRREARRADWGAGRGSSITYRFFVEELTLIPQDGVLTIRCTALGKLPKGKSAKSRITFSGDPRERRKLIERVMEIVARGVITRLAELERARRTVR